MEIELKLGLVESAALDRLVSVLPPAAAVVLQRNHYFADAAGRLDAVRVMVRVREELDATAPGAPAGRVLITAKRRTTRRAGVFVAEEHEAELAPEVWRAVLGGARDLADLTEHPVVAWVQAQVGVASLASRGVLENLRRRVPCEGLVLEVDRTSFADGSVDAEVEVEVAGEDEAQLAAELRWARQLVEAAAARAGVALFEQTKGKYRRFLERVVGR